MTGSAAALAGRIREELEEVARTARRARLYKKMARCFPLRYRLSISEARKRLSFLLKTLQEEPENVYEITVNEMVVGEIRGVETARYRVGTGEDLLHALDRMGKPETEAPPGAATAREHDRFLYTR